MTIFRGIIRKAQGISTTEKQKNVIVGSTRSSLRYESK